MLQEVVKSYLKVVKSKTFLPNPDYPEFVSADCLDVVIKRKPKWIWQKPIYTYDDFGLNDLLDVPLLSEDAGHLLMKEVPLTTDYVCSTKHSVKGKLGAKILSLVNFEVDGDDIVTLNINMQGLVRKSIDFSEVQKMLKTRKVDLQGPYLNRLAQDKYNVVCIVSKYIYITKPLEIKVTVTKDFGESIDVTKLKVNTDDTGSYNETRTKSIIFDAGTKIAFEFSECLISDDGHIELLDDSDQVKKTHMIPKMKNKLILPNHSTGSFSGDHITDVVDSGDSGSLVALFKALCHLLNEQKVSDVKKCLLHLALEKKKILRKFELFILYSHQETANKEVELDSLKFFDQDMLQDDFLVLLFESLGILIKEKKMSICTSSFHLLEGVLCLIHAIYHLEQPHLQLILDLINTGDRSTMVHIVLFLQNIKFLDFRDQVMYSRLFKDVQVKRLLSIVGVLGTSVELTEYFEPVLILLYGNL